MKQSKPIRLDEEYAVRRVPLGWYIFAYSDDQGKIHENIYAGHVLLSCFAAQELADYVCSEVGGCDTLKDAQIDEARARSELAQHIIEVGPGE